MTIGVEDLGRAEPVDRLVQRLDAKVSLKGVRDAPGQDAAGEPVQHGGKVDEPAHHRNVGDVHRPDLVGPGNGQLPEQLGVDLVSQCWFRSVRLAIEGFEAHALHQRGNVQPPDLEPLLDQQTPQHAAAREGELHVQLVDPVHRLQIGIRDRALLVIDGSPADPQHYEHTSFGDLA